MAGGRAIGPGSSAFVAVEVGLNHNGDPDLAHRMVDAAADAGVDGVKFQHFRTEDFIHDRSLTYEYVSQGETVTESQWDMFRRAELPPPALVELQAHCAERGVVFFATPTGFETLEDLIEMGTPLLKNGSDYLQHSPLIRRMAESGIPTVLSTGMASEPEVGAAVEAFRSAGGTELVLLACTSTYPTPPAEVHLRKIPELADRFACPVGLSDHTDGALAAAASVALGSCMIEKHFTLDRGLPGPDHRFSVDPAGLRALVDMVREVELMLGRPELAPAPTEAVGRVDYRLGCVAGADLPRGHVLAAADILFRRPAAGAPPSEVETLLGRPLVRDVREGEPLSTRDVA
jgi:N-acetylneuraminate synthase/N,N'-diacetyllegionaminate synthase